MRVVLIGAGKMGLALLNGWLGEGAGHSLLACEPQPSAALLALAESDARLTLVRSPEAIGIDRADVLVLAVKPQIMGEALAPLRRLVGRDTIVLSIAAGRTVRFIADGLGGAPKIVRAMPNTPAAIGRGVTGLYAGPGVTAEEAGIARSLLAALGSVVEVDEERLIDAVTAVSGSGPAYVFLFAECLARAAERLGLEPGVAAELARATVSGAGALLDASPETPEALRVAVTSPGGTTAAALQHLMAEEGLQPLLDRAVRAAFERAGVLAGDTPTEKSHGG